MKYIAIIPARYASTRFPGKPLELLGGKPIIQWVYERVNKVFNNTLVATDDERIYNVVLSFGGKTIMTKPTHPSGTDRCYEAYLNSGIDADVVVNVQGDEPFIDASQLESIKACFSDTSIHIATLVKPFKSTDSVKDLENPNTPKVVVDGNNNALYFSRSIIPHLRGKDKNEWLKNHTYYKHIGLYAYRVDVLEQITRLPQGTLEKAESLEQLRWLEAGYKIKVGMTTIETIGIDTPEDLKKAEALISQ